MITKSKKREKKPDLFTLLPPKPQTEIRETAASIKAKIRKAIIKNPDVSARELMKKITGASLVTMAALRTQIKSQLKEQGLIPDRTSRIKLFGK